MGRRNKSFGKMRKARSGRNKSKPDPHKQHRNKGAVVDPISRSFKRESIRQREDKLQPKYEDDLEDFAGIFT